jgi:hypothetical protein
VAFSRRVAKHRTVSTALAALGDTRLSSLVAGAREIGTGIGGASAVADVGGFPVFVKRVALTDLERRPENVMSTANIFGLPPFYQYGVGSTGFGAWRELTAHRWTTGWVLDGRTEAFPLMYHWRVLPGAPPPPDQTKDVERAVAYWEGSAAVRTRLHALATASASLVLFLEYLPHDLHDWLSGQSEEAYAMVERRLRADVAFMNGAGLLHFDAHFGNVRTDGERLYLGDLGLATSPDFDLSPAEAEFVARHASHDLCHSMTQLVNRLERNGAGGAIVGRYAPVADVMNAFYRRLFTVSRATPYPEGELARAMALARL